MVRAGGGWHGTFREEPVSPQRLGMQEYIALHFRVGKLLFIEFFGLLMVKLNSIYFNHYLLELLVFQLFICAKSPSYLIVSIVLKLFSLNHKVKVYKINQLSRYIRNILLLN